MRLEEHLRVELRRQRGELAAAAAALHQRFIARVREPHRVTDLVCKRHDQACFVNFHGIGIHALVQDNPRIVPRRSLLASNDIAANRPELNGHRFWVRPVNVFHPQEAACSVDPGVHRLLDVRAVTSGVVDLERVPTNVAVARSKEVTIDVGNLFTFVHLFDGRPALCIPCVRDLFIGVHGRGTDDQRGSTKSGGTSRGENFARQHRAGNDLFVRND
ncbi:hypothetical protein MHJ95_08015 [Corynebacterium imitans]|uniref:hypothetical protein n=1 Tax=Corynebacterium imitans TaxID=156978 RepID=UPI001EF3450A|nr:hypothetical protein [Corynebacterium imitans]MCG7278927.1 hypothetical protein [Corynebacterium imitans]